MMRTLLRSALLALAITADAPSLAQTLDLRRPEEPPDVAVEIVGGHKAAAGDWPATFIFDAAGGGFCTATAVGPHVLLTAAHCLPASASGKIRNTTVKVLCERAPLDNYGYDVALCVTSATIPIAPHQPYESVSLSAKPTLGAPLEMLGYGCTGQGGDSGVLYEGEAKLGTWFLEGRQFTSSGTVALCSGDSGGGTYSPIGSGRRIVGVASDIFGSESRFALLAHPQIQKFIGDWQRRQVNPATKQSIEVKICGIDGTSAYCRN